MSYGSHITKVIPESVPFRMVNVPGNQYFDNDMLGGAALTPG